MVKPDKALELYHKKQYQRAHQAYKNLLAKIGIQHRAELYNNMGLCSSYFDIIQAESDYKSAIRLGSKNAEWNYCILLLNNNRMPEAWNYWVARFFTTYSTKVNVTTLPIPFKYHNTLNREQKILVLQEQGLGDEIMFLPTLFDLAKTCEQVVWQVSQPLYDLYQYLQLPENTTIITGNKLAAELVYSCSCYTYAGEVFAKYRPDPASFENVERLKINTEASDKVWAKKLPEKFIAVQAFTNPDAPNHKEKTIQIPETTLPIVSLNHFKMPYPEHVLQPQIKGLIDCISIAKLAQSVVLASSALSQLFGVIGVKAEVHVPDSHDQWRFKYLNNQNSQLFPCLTIIRK